MFISWMQIVMKSWKLKYRKSSDKIKKYHKSKICIGTTKLCNIFVKGLKLDILTLTP